MRSRVSSIGSCPVRQCIRPYVIELKGQTLKVSSEQSSLPSGLYKKISNRILCFELVRRVQLKFVKTFIGNFPGTFAKVRTLKDFVLVNSDRFLKRGMNSFLLAHAVNSLMLVIPKSWLKRSL